jgi:Fic family protein
MNNNDFIQPSGKLIRTLQGEAAYTAFMPNPLPPKIEWGSEIIGALSQADRALGELAGLGRTLVNPNLLIEPFLRREAVSSSRIEGTEADITDLYAYEAGQLQLPGMKTGTRWSDVVEVAKYLIALRYGLERINELPISLRLIREIHSRLMQGTQEERSAPGEFRIKQNWIGTPGCTLNDASFVPPPVAEMRDA